MGQTINSGAETMNINNTLSTPTSNTGVYLSVGAAARQGAYDGQGWRPIGTAPKDGTIIEIRCTYGVAPWYGLYRWSNGIRYAIFQGQEVKILGSPGWVKVGDDMAGFEEDPTFSWRPYTGNASIYVDPTGGAQDSPEYWRGAVAAKYGLPLDTFEKSARRRSLWERFWGWLVYPQ